MSIEKYPKEELPREKILNNGVESLTNIELIAILIRCGNKEKDVFSLSAEVLTYLNNYGDLNNITINDLLNIKGIGLSKASIILSSIELTKRLISRKINKIKLPSPSLIFEHFKPIYYNVKQEQVYVIYFDTKGNVISEKLITIGNINSSVLDEKTIFNWAFRLQATALILIHNHPSGDATPSKEDIEMTKRLLSQANLLGFTLLDHIIIGDGYFSFKQNFKFI